jgi:hypothetical protein
MQLQPESPTDHVVYPQIIRTHSREGSLTCTFVERFVAWKILDHEQPGRLFGRVKLDALIDHDMTASRSGSHQDLTLQLVHLRADRWRRKQIASENRNQDQ